MAFLALTLFANEPNIDKEGPYRLFSMLAMVESTEKVPGRATACPVGNGQRPTNSNNNQRITTLHTSYLTQQHNDEVIDLHNKWLKSVSNAYGAAVN